MKNQQTPFARYLADLPEWDKTTRLDTLFTGYLGADNTPFNRKAAELLGIAAVARAECPGISWNQVPILIGKQGVRKSSFLKALFGDTRVGEIWTLAYGDKGLCEELGDFACIELCCLGWLDSRWHETTLRDFINRNTDEYRKTYERRMTKSPRHCVFVGTTNDTGKLIDPTGNNRVWEINVKIAEIDTDAVVFERNQIWAEAKHLWQLAVVAAGDKCSLDLNAMAANLPARVKAANE